MIPSILQWIDGVRRARGILAGDVLEVGSRDVNGSARLAFQDSSSYLGVDLEGGQGVDVVLDVVQLGEWRLGRRWDSVVCCETLEHVVRPWLAVEQLKAALLPGGYLWVSTPGYGFPVHRFPIDCYRYGEDAYRLWLFADMELVELTRCYDSDNNFALAA